MHVEAHDPIESLPHLRRLKSHRTIAMRLQIVILAQQGRTAPQVVAATGISRRAVQEWVRQLQPARHRRAVRQTQTRGKPTQLPGDQEQAFKQRILAGPTRADGALCTLRGKDAQRILGEQFGVSCSLGGAIDLMHRVGLSCLKPRPRHRKNNPQAMQQWLDDAPLWSSKSKKNTRKNKSKSGSRSPEATRYGETKHASANKAR